jgi:hypothetical protein
VDSPITKKSRENRSQIVMRVFIHNTLQKSENQHEMSGNSITKVEVRIQNLHHGYKSCIWFSKMASGFTNWRLVLQFSDFSFVMLKNYIGIMYKSKYILINNKACDIF